MKVQGAWQFADRLTQSAEVMRRSKGRRVLSVREVSALLLPNPLAQATEPEIISISRSSAQSDLELTSCVKQTREARAQTMQEEYRQGLQIGIEARE